MEWCVLILTQQGCFHAFTNLLLIMQCVGENCWPVSVVSSSPDSEVLAEGGAIFILPKVGEDEDVSIDLLSSTADVVVADRELVSLSFLMLAVSTSLGSSGFF